MAIERAVAYLDRVSFEQLPILPTGDYVPVAGVYCAGAGDRKDKPAPARVRAEQPDDVRDLRVAWPLPPDQEGEDPFPDDDDDQGTGPSSE